MSKVFVFVEMSSASEIKRSSAELLTAAKKSGLSVVAMACGSAAEQAKAALEKYGVSEFLLLKDAKMDSYNPELFTDAVSQAITGSESSIVLASASALGKDLFPRVAMRLEAGIISDCTELKFNDGSVEVKKPLYAGKCFAKMGFQNTKIQIVLMRPNQLPIEESPSSLAVKELSVPQKDLKTIIKNVVRGASEKMDLTEANIIVSGGRGLKEAGNFKLLHDLADVLGATVGASRAVVDAGWVPHDMQVGQTGKTVAPSLYIAVGISGAIQHLAGMSGSKVIVAINNDPNAPIFQKATYGIVGDLFEVVPRLTEEFKKALQ